MDLQEPKENVRYDGQEVPDENLDENPEDPEENDNTANDVDAVRQAFLQNSTAECLLNREGDQLPFGLFNPETEGKLTWICGEDADSKITSVYSFDQTTAGGQIERACSYLEDHKQAITIRDELLRNGWKLLIPPKIEFTMAEGDKQVPLNRRQRRFLAKKMTQAEKELGLRPGGKK